MATVTWWYLSRGTGLVAWAALAVEVLSGALCAGRLGPQRLRATLSGLHPFLGGTGITVTIVHVAVLMIHGWIPFGWLEVLVPFTSSWRPVALAFGVVAAELLVAVQLSSVARRRLPRRAWVAIHLTSYGAFWAATVHAATAGTDAASSIVAAGGGVIVVVSMTAIAVRWWRRPPASRRRPAARAGGRRGPTGLAADGPRAA